MKKKTNKLPLFAVSTENLKNLKHHISWKKHQLFLLFAVSVKMKMRKCLKKKNQLEKYSKMN